MAYDMLELVKFIARSLVESPDEVKVKQVEGEKSIVLELTVAPDDMGKVIGKSGRTAKAIRTVLGVAASKAEVRADLKIVEDEDDNGDAS